MNVNNLLSHIQTTMGEKAPGDLAKLTDLHR